MHIFGLSLSDGVRNDDIAAQRDADEQVDDQTDDRAVCANRRDTGRACAARKVADDGDVRGIKELLQNCRCRDGQCKARQFVPDRPMQHIKLLFSGCFHK